MSTGHLTIDLDAIAANWQALDALTGVPTAAVVKADGYGCHAPTVAARLLQAGATKFFVAVAKEGAALRHALGEGPEIYVFSGVCAGDAPLILEHALIPCLNSAEQADRFLDTGLPFAIQLDTGMNRLGMEADEWAAVRDEAIRRGPKLVMSHLACADEPGHPMNAGQLATFHEMTEGLTCPRSLAATGGILLGPDYHFDLTRPGVGLYGGDPFAGARPVVTLDLPVIQTRAVAAGETVGYGNMWRATRDSRVATVSAGYADGLIRAMGAGTVQLFAGDTPCPLIGRVSMDLITVDVTDAGTLPPALTLLNARQTVDDLAAAAGTIGYEILTSLGARYERRYEGLQ